MAVQLFAILAILVFSIEASVNKVKVDCGNPLKGISATVKFIGDARAVFAFAADDKKCKFSTGGQMGEFEVKVGYNASDGCRFIQAAPERASYAVHIETRLLHEMVEGYNDEKFTVVCNYMKWAKMEYTFDVVSRFKPPVMQFVNNAKQAKSVFTVFMVNIKGGKLTGPLPEKRVVKLRAQMKPPLQKGVKEVGFQPLQCVAQPSGGGRSMVILSDGCGTGFPWKINAGFTMNGLIGDSPKFRLFRLHRKQGIKVSCHFVVCTVPCNVNSCPAARKAPKRVGKRSAELPAYVQGFLPTSITIGTNNTVVRDSRLRPTDPQEEWLAVNVKSNTLKIDPKESVQFENDALVSEPSAPLPKFNGVKESQSSMNDVYIEENRATLFIAASSVSSIVLLVTIFLTAYILTKINQTHHQILRLNGS